MSCIIEIRRAVVPIVSVGFLALTSALLEGGAFSKAAAAQMPYQDVSGAELRQQMTPAAALRVVRDALKRGLRGDHGIFGSGCDTKYEGDSLTFSGVSYTRVEVCENSRYEAAPEVVKLRFDVEEEWQRFRRLGSALGILHAVDAIGYYTSGRDVADDAPAFARFCEGAATWRALAAKPPLPDGARRASVMAEDAIQRRSFEEAVDNYETGLRAMPFWPEGHFNAALLYGELDLFGQAVIHMKRYLELVPNAPDAPAARDQVVVWEGRIAAKLAAVGQAMTPAAPAQWDFSKK